MQQGILFSGKPDSVYRQIMEFYDKVGGFGHLAMIGRSGFMTHAESVKGIKLFAREVAAAFARDQAGGGGVAFGRNNRDGPHPASSPKPT